MLVAGLIYFIGGATLVIISLFLKVSFNILFKLMPYLFSVGAFSIALSILLFFFALREIGSMQIGIIFLHFLFSEQYSLL